MFKMVGRSGVKVCALWGAVVLSLVVSPATAQAARALRTHPMEPFVRVHGSAQPGVSSTGQLWCQSPKAKYYCYLPGQMRTAYSVAPLLAAGNDGSKRTIAIVDAFQDPTIASDFARFDSQSGIPAPPSFRTIAPFGLTPYNASDPNQNSWSLEVALDVEWAHAIAPGANILLALAPTNADADIVNVQQYVIEHHLADVVSMSFGEAEQCEDPNLLAQQHALYQSATAAGVTFVAGSGDEGAAQFACAGKGYFLAASTPASDPFVTGVGGTNLLMDLTSGTYQSESVWNEQGTTGAGGGGFSAIYPRPGYQSGLVTPGYTTRGVPDVTYSASSAWGVYVAWASSGTPYVDWSVYGTSCGTPQWAAIFAIADEAARRDLGNVNPTLYSLGQSNAAAAYYHDITDGNNSFPTVAGFSATPGWDPASGLGSPIADNLVPALATG